jgi:ectoine hydroxylase-related dioxygenase (phytanoyl-CoA dioxygenase family)
MMQQEDGVSGGVASVSKVLEQAQGLAVEQVETYRRDGFLTVPGFFSEADLAPVEAYLQRHADDTWTHKNDDPLREAHYHYRPLYDLCTLPRLLDTVEVLLGPDLVLLYSHIMNKKPGGLRVAWHQDGPYWPRVEPKIAVTAWIPLDDATPENGCMRVIPGTQRGHRDLGQRSTDTPDLIQDQPFELPPDLVDEARAVDIILRRGDLSLHDSYLVHGSEPNRSGNRRAALTIRYVPAVTRIEHRPDRMQYLVRGKEAGNGNIYHRFGDRTER